MGRFQRRKTGGSKQLRVAMRLGTLLVGGLFLFGTTFYFSGWQLGNDVEHPRDIPGTSQYIDEWHRNLQVSESPPSPVPRPPWNALVVRVASHVRPDEVHHHHDISSNLHRPTLPPPLSHYPSRRMIHPRCAMMSKTTSRRYVRATTRHANS